MQVIGMHIGSSFAQVNVRDTDQSISSPNLTASALFYLPRQNLKTALPRFLAELPFPASQIGQAQITSRFLERLFEFRLGGSTAQLVTAGFESWPFLNSSASKPGWIHPAKSLPIASQELSFPIDERTEAGGKISKNLDVETLLPIVEKLKATSIKRVCVHFLHATKNPQNQDRAAQFLKDQGFEVFLPPEAKESEGSRWRKSTLEASFAGTFEELRQDIEQGLQSLLTPEKILFHDGKKFVPATQLNRVSSLFGEDELLVQKSSQWVLDLGLESWRLLQTKAREQWQSPWGPVALEKPWRRDLRWQPTLAFEKNELNELVPGKKSEGYEPGPLSFGRGQKFLVFDLLSEQLKFFPGLKEQMPDTAEGRRTAALTALARDTQSKDGPSLQKKLMEQMAREISAEVKTWTEGKPVHLTGIFAPLLKKDLQSQLSLTEGAP